MKIINRLQTIATYTIRLSYRQLIIGVVALLMLTVGISVVIGI